MTKKDYIIVAHVIGNYIAVCRNTGDEETETFLKKMISDMCIEFEKDNNKFIASRFISACGVVLDF